MMENWRLRQKFNTLSEHSESFGNPFNQPHYLDFVTKIIYPNISYFIVQPVTYGNVKIGKYSLANNKSHGLSPSPTKLLWWL